MLSEQFLEELKMHSNMEEIVSSYVQLKRGGRNLVGLCPFHSEKSPSFNVYEDSQSFYCFGCGAGGDVITFIKRIENLDYIEAVKRLADRAGIPMPQDGFDDRAARLKTRVLEINRQTARFFHTCLVSPQGKAALDYLHARQLSDKTIRHFGLGYAPNAWDALLRHLRAQGFAEEELVSACVVARRRGGDGCYDQFRDRIMFPIIDIRGNVIAFGGRIMEGSGPKYLNSPDTPVFKKSRNLFALNLAKATKKNTLLLAEGYMDVIALHQAGFDNAVATLGTAMTNEQARLMASYSAQVIICYDSDGPGQTATKRAINLFAEIGLKVRVLAMQGAKDPDEYIKKFGRERFQALLDGSSNALEFELAKIKAHYDLSLADGRMGYLKEFADYMVSIQNPIERDIYIAKTANELEVSREAVQNQVTYLLRRKVKSKEKKDQKELKVFAVNPQDRVNPQRNRHLRAALAEERLIAVLFKNPDYCAYITERLKPENFATEFNRKVYEALCRQITQNRTISITMFGEEFDDAQMGRIAGMLAAANGQNYTKEETDDYIAAIQDAACAKTDKDVVQMNEDQYRTYIAGLASKKK